MSSWQVEWRDGYPVWAGSDGAVEVRFVGRWGSQGPGETLRGIGEERGVAWARQVHSARVVQAEGEGEAGTGDALVSGRVGLALAVATADCVPVLVAGEREVTAVHAGWRGIAAGVVGEALKGLEGDLTAWVGPAIGACCYEVGEEVAQQVVEASAPSVARPSPGGKPYLDLQAAAGHQLRAAGVREVRTLAVCTRCSPDTLWSYRRDGAGTGRNFAFIWRHPT